MKEVGANLKSRRESLGLSQEETAGRAHMNIRNYQRLEGGEGNPTLETMLALAKALKTTLDALTGQPGYAKAQVAEQVAQAARLERWAEAADLLASVARAKPVRRLVGLYILTREKRYLDALLEVLPPQSPLLQWLDQAP